MPDWFQLLQYIYTNIFHFAVRVTPIYPYIQMFSLLNNDIENSHFRRLSLLLNLSMDFIHFALGISHLMCSHMSVMVQLLQGVSLPLCHNEI